jgi:spore coat polysaccharide biosynthesis protein SpsF
MSRVIAVIQARLNSTRLPRKALLPLAGKPMITNIVERVSRAKRIDGVVVATPFKDVEEISRYVPCETMAPDIDENDLIKRFYMVGLATKADLVIRLAADNPCVEPEYIDDLIAWRRQCDEWFKLHTNMEWPEMACDAYGGEAYPMGMLEWLDKSIGRVDYREHPHRFWYDVDAYRYCGNREWSHGLRLDVNTQQDYEKLVKLYNYFGGNEFHAREAVEWAKENLEERSLS